MTPLSFSATFNFDEAALAAIAKHYGHTEATQALCVAWIEHIGAEAMKALITEQHRESSRALRDIAVMNVRQMHGDVLA